MKSGLTISINNNHIVISNTIGIITVCSKIYKGNINQLHSFLELFINKHSIKPSDINSIIIVCDITKLYLPASKTNNKIGYIQIIPEQKNYYLEKKSVHNRNIKIYTFNVGLPKDNNYKENIKNAVSFFNEKKITQIAVNSYFSLMNVERENEAVDIIKKASKDNITVMSSNMYNMSNFLQRKNYLLLNLVYYNTTKSLLDKLHNSLESIGIFCPIYFLRSSGLLLDEKSILNNSFSTYHSEYTSKIMGSSYITNNNNSVVICNNENKIYASSIHNRIPVCSLEENTFSNLKIPYHFPKFIYLSETDNLKEIKKMINHISIKDNDFLPIINLTSTNLDTLSLTNPIINIIDSPELACIGASIANYKRQFIDIVFNTNEEKNNMMKNTLLNKAKKYIESNNIIIKNINYKFEFIPLKYMRYNSCYIKLSIEGQIGNEKQV